MADIFRVKGQVLDLHGVLQPYARIQFVLRNTAFGSNFVIPAHQSDFVTGPDGFFQADLIAGDYQVAVSFDGKPRASFPMNIPEGRDGFIEILPYGAVKILSEGSVALSGVGPVTATFTAPTTTGSEPITVSLAATLDGSVVTVTGSDGNGTAAGIERGSANKTLQAVWTAQAAVGDAATSAATIAVPAAEAPAAALAPTLTPVSATAMSVTIAADQSDGGGAITDRTLAYTVNGGPAVEVAGLAAGATHTITTGLAEGDTVEAAVSTTNVSGTTQGATSAQDTMLLPEAPLAPSVADSTESIVVTRPADPELNGQTSLGMHYRMYDAAGAQIGTGVLAGAAGDTVVVMVGPQAGLQITAYVRTIAGDGHESPKSEAATSYSGFEATVDELARDPIVYDTGASRGQNRVAMPLSGTTNATDGTDIEVAMEDATTSTIVHDFQVVGQAAAGVWSGTFSLSNGARHSDYLRPVARPAGPGSTSGTTTNRVGFGIKEMGTNQSISQRAIGSRAKAIVPANNDLVRVFLSATSTGAPAWYDGKSASIPAGLSQFIDSMSKNAPCPVEIGLEFQDGNPFATSFTPAAAGGRLEKTLVVRDELNSTGSKVGTAVFDHMWDIRGDGYTGPDLIYHLFFGITAAGADFDFGAASASHCLFDLSSSSTGTAMFDASETALVFADSHMVQSSSSTTRYNLSTLTNWPANDTTPEGVTARLREIWATGDGNPAIQATMGSKMAYGCCAYQNGSATDMVGETLDPWSDVAHTSRDTDAPYGDGSTQRARQLGLMYLSACGLGPEQPMLDTIEIIDDHTVDWSSSAGPITTRAYDRTADDVIHGVTLGRLPVTATLVAGKVRVTLANGAEFSKWHKLRIGEAGQHSALSTADLDAGICWNNYPLVEVATGNTHDERAVPVRPVAHDSSFTPYQYVGGTAYPGAQLTNENYKSVGEVNANALGPHTAMRVDALMAPQTGESLWHMRVNRNESGPGSGQSLYYRVYTTAGNSKNTPNYVFASGEVHWYTWTTDTTTGLQELFVDGVKYMAETTAPAGNLDLAQFMYVGGTATDRDSILCGIWVYLGSTDTAGGATLSIAGDHTVFAAGNTDFEPVNNGTITAVA